MSLRDSVAMLSVQAGDRAWKTRQEKVFTNWINVKLKKKEVKGQILKVENLYDDLSDGRILYYLMEVLSGQSMRPLGKLSTGKMKIQKISNMNIVWKYIEQTVKTVGIGPTDVVDKEEKLVLGLLWSIIVFFMIKDLGGMDDVAALKKKVTKWVKRKVAGHDDVEITNLTTSFADGKAFLAILNNIDPAGCPYNPSDDPVKNLTEAFKDMDEKFGIPCLVDPSDPDFWEDEKTMMTQLAELMHQLPEMVEQPKHPIDEWIDDNMDRIADDIAGLAQIPSIPEDPDHINDVDEAAAKVADMMKDSGLGNVLVDKDGGEGPPFVFGEKGSDSSKPTVLLYSNYTVSAPDDPAGGTWDGNPFIPIKDGDKVAAKGVAEDKGHVATSLATVKAIMDTLGDGDLPVNVKVVVGGIPPPTHKAYDPTNSTAKMKDFCERNKDKLMPDYILVSEPDGSLLAQSAAAGMFSCRGFVTFDAAVSTVTPPAGTEPFCSRWVGPCVDPGIALLSAVGSLRDDDGSIAVKGMDSFPVSPTIANAVKQIKCTEEQLREASGYLPTVGMALVKGTTLAEQLCFYPGLNAGIKASAEFNDLPEATIPRSATITVHANLPPTQPVADAYEKITAHIKDNMPYGIEVEFSNMKGEPGWCSDPSNSFYKATTSAMEVQHAPREAVSLGNPEYKPVPATFANVFGKPTYMHGVNDPSRSIGHANEQIKLDDVRKEIKALIQTLAGIGGMSLDGPTGPMPGPGAVAIKTPVEIAASTSGGGGGAGPKGSSLRGKGSTLTKGTGSRAGAESTLGAPGGTSAANPPVAPNASAADGIPKPPVAEMAADHDVAPEEVEAAVEMARASLADISDLEIPGQEEEGAPDAIHKKDPSQSLSRRRASIMSAPGGKDIELCLKEINELRMDPPAYAKKLEALTSCFSEVEGNKVFTDPADGRMIATHEGAEALMDAIKALSAASPVGPLLWKEGVAAAAADHSTYLGFGNTGHVGKDDDRAADRLSQYGTWLELCGEVIAYRERTAEAMVRQMLLCDGEKTRTDRNTLLNPLFKVCGIASADHPSLDAVVVVVLTCGFFGQAHSTEATVETKGEATPEFRTILDSIPVLQVHEEILAALEGGSTVKIDYKPGGSATYTITAADGSGATKFIEWGGKAQTEVSGRCEAP